MAHQQLPGTTQQCQKPYQTPQSQPQPQPQVSTSTRSLLPPPKSSPALSMATTSHYHHPPGPISSNPYSQLPEMLWKQRYNVVSSAATTGPMTSSTSSPNHNLGLHHRQDEMLPDSDRTYLSDKERFVR